jgi:rhodanese-related sulfurtransferase
MKMMKMKMIVCAALVSCLVFAAAGYAASFPEDLVKKMAAMKADAEAKKEMPATIDGLPIVDTEAAHKLLKGKAIFLDNRVKTQFDTEKIAGAQWFFCDTLIKDPARADKLDKSKEYVVYCNGVFCWRSPAVGMMLKQLGFTKVFWYRDGLPAWKKKGLPTE